MNPDVCMVVARIRDFTGMNYQKFHSSKVDKDPQELIDEVHKIVGIMDSTMVEKVE